MNTETIVAPASPPGVGAISILRVSGPRAFECVRRLLSGEILKEAIQPRKMYLTKLADGELLDRAMVAFYPGPNSYTGENLVEIFCHGGEVISSSIISALQKHGGRLAGPGEFTRRAVENGKLDLLQAEAIHDLITAESPAAASNALRQLDGELSEKIEGLREPLIKLSALLELELDFAEEDVVFASRDEVARQLKEIVVTLDQLIHSYEKGRGLRSGLRVAIVGKPNVGKSSLLNAILGTERAIVSPHPGTTRDFIEEPAQIGALKFRFIDTAGIRHSAEGAEQEGIKRTKRRIQDAHILLFVVDAASPHDELDGAIAEECLDACTSDKTKKLILIYNKIDLNSRINGAWSVPCTGQVKISALKNEGIADLLQLIEKIANEQFFRQQAEVLITNLRQKQALEKARVSLAAAQESILNKLSGEFIARDLRAASDELASLIGAISSEEILDEIFANFCIGK
jgi:tRNA modification GTPase